MSGSDIRSDALDPPLTDAEHRAVEAMRIAHAIVGGEPLVPYDVVGMAREVERLREAVEGLQRAAESDRLLIGRLCAEVSRLREALEQCRNTEDGQVYEIATCALIAAETFRSEDA